MAPEQVARQHDRIRALANAGAVLHLGAHPDDEDSGMVAYMSRRHAARTVYWSATRGEGGQNRRGPERNEALGVVRTWESLDARRLDGGEVLYGPFYDFGFSKSGEDTLRRWGRDAVVGEVVRAIRSVQPLVVVCRWSGTADDGHGHHQAVGLVAEEAFDAAADPERFPELGLPPWRAAKLYRSVAGDWQPGEDGSFGVLVPEYEQAGYLRLDTGEVDPVAEVSYQEQAHTAVNRHRSQGIGFVPEPGPYFYYYRLVRSPSAPPSREASFYDGLDPLLTGLGDDPRLTAARAALETAAENFRPDRPTACLPRLVEAWEALSALEAVEDDEALARYLTRRTAEIEEVVAGFLSVRVECLADRARITPGREVRVVVRVWGGADPVDVEKVELHVPDGWLAVRTSADDGPPHPSHTAQHEVVYLVTVPADVEPQAPYWLRAPRGPYRYAWPERSPSLGQPLDEPLVWTEVVVRGAGATCTVRSAAVQRSGFPGGSRLLPLTVLPPVALSPRQQREILPITGLQRVLDLDVTVQCIEPDGARAVLTPVAPDGWTVDPPAREVLLGGAGDTVTRRFRVHVPASAAPGGYALRYELQCGGRSYDLELRPVRLGVPGATAPPDEHTAVVEAYLLRPVSVAVDLVDARFIKTLRYGYVHGLEESIVPSLARFELDLAEVGDDQLEFADLGEFDAIVLGPNAYSVRPAVRRSAARLLDFVAQGGTLVVQYQTYGYDVGGLTPFPVRFSQPHDRVTDPQAPVTLVDPANPVLTAPNAIGPADFDGWVHDRGLYFLGEWDRRYTPVLASADVGEPPREGGLLTASFGRGTYVYAAYSFHRQIPAGVAGAVRLFANLLGLAEVRVRERMARLGELELFRFMTEAQLYEAARSVSERWVDAGAYLAREGERGHEMFILVDGSVEVLHGEGDGERLVHVAGPGEELGELTLLADIPRSASLRAATDVVVLVIRDDALEEWLQRHPDLGRGMMRRLAHRVVETTGQLS
ncbi:cyclic nucleotide-binding domain-containing protein [Petropleomorpha daqingensis]|uniref:LmbE family N-acetylglucosaminyl deacetylase n=1 Tax=Petropleomorpha daqingensis TaxID=2026353 RepID=A0A853CEV8_9ACTN|nr:LmbE family N-acetylglucosaminyl deacetylase [Petropleomorpha daqingensis]